MKTIIREEQCLVCKGTGQRSWFYRYGESIAFILFSSIVYIEFWHDFSKGWRTIFLIGVILSIIDIIVEKNKNKRGKCKNCNGTGKIILEDVIEDK